MPGVSNAELAEAITALSAAAAARDQSLSAWQAGTATGGPMADGRYPISDYVGNTVLVSSPARLEALVLSLTEDADGAVQVATSMRDEVAAMLATVNTKTTLASGHAAAAATSASQADTFRQQAAAHEANALAHRNAAATFNPSNYYTKAEIDALLS